MGDIAIHVEHLGKEYRIGQKAQYSTFRDAITNAATAPFKSFNKKAHPNDGQGKFWALKDVSFDIEKGEVVGIIGRNGAGKSTLLKILSRITEPTEGSATIHGRVGSLLEVGTGFHPELTGRENIYLSGAILGMKKSEIDSKFDDIVKFAETEKFLDTPLKHYSSGMQVRLGFAVAAHLEPEILIVDEVLAVGDFAFQKKCLGKMGDISKDGRTVLFVSHNMNAVEQLCSKGILLDKGSIVQNSDNIKTVINDYLFNQTHINIANEWTNDNNEYNNPWFKPLKIYICDENGKSDKVSFSNNSDIRLNIEAEIKELAPSLTIGYAIYDENSNLLYWSYQTDGSEDKWPILKMGICNLTSKIPKLLLNEGTYRIELIGGLHFSEWLFEPSKKVPCIYLTIKGGLSVSPLWMTKRPGILAPVNEWSVNYVFN